MSEEEKKLTGPSFPRWLPKRSYDLDFDDSLFATPPGDADSFLRLDFRQRSATIERPPSPKADQKLALQPVTTAAAVTTTASQITSLPAPLMKSKSVSEIDIEVTGPFGSVESVNSLIDDDVPEGNEIQRRRHTSSGSKEHLEIEEAPDSSVDYLKPGYIAGRMSKSLPTTPVTTPVNTIASSAPSQPSPRALRRKVTPPVHMFFTGMTTYTQPSAVTDTTTTTTDTKSWFYTGPSGYGAEKKDALPPVMEEGSVSQAGKSAKVSPGLTGTGLGRGSIGQQVQAKQLTALKQRKKRMMPKASQLREMNCWTPSSM